MSGSNPKPLIYFVPIYIASLKYYAKLFPYFKDRYDVRFLIVRGRDVRRKQMIEHCLEEGYAYDLLEKGLSKGSIRIPFLTSFYKRYVHIKECREFLKFRQPTKIVSPGAHPICIKEANRLGIETVLLQWALAFSGDIPVERKAKNFVLKIYYIVMNYLYTILDWFYGVLDPRLELFQKVGVIDEETGKLFGERWNIPRSEVVVVGIVDYQLVYELKKRVDTNVAFKSALESKYSLSSGKRNILVVARAAHLHSPSGVSLKEQLAQSREILEMVRGVFSSGAANLLFKLHPSDDPSLYDSFKDLEIKIYADKASTDELICLSDLIISDPWTSANYAIVASNSLALFPNFSSLQSFNKLSKYYGIKHVIGDKGEFVTDLKRFKNKELSLQYNNSHIDVHSIDNIVAFVD